MARKDTSNGVKSGSRPTTGLLLGGTFDEYEKTIRKSLVEAAEKNGCNLLCYSGSSFSRKDSQRDKVYDFVTVKKLMA